MKKLYLLFSLSLFCIFSKAQVSVTATAGTTGPTSYTNLADAAEAVNTGTHQGIVNITVSGNTIETLPVGFVKSGTSGASYSSVTVSPAAGVAATISTDMGSPLLLFNGSSNITVDGLNTGGSSLTFINNSTQLSASCVNFTSGAQFNILRKCTLLGSSVSTTSGVITFGAAGTSLGNSNNQVLDNNIGDAPGGTPANGIYSQGTTLNNGFNTVTGNNIYNYFQPGMATAGILLSTNSNAWRLEGNHFYQTVARTFSAGFIHRAILVADGSNTVILSNVIGGSAADGSGLYELSGSATRFTAIEVSAGSSLATFIDGNIVRNIQLTTTSGAGAPQGIFCGIYITGGRTTVGTFLPNTIGALDGNGSIKIIPSTGGGVVTGINYNGSSDLIDIENNVVGSIDLTPTGVLSGNVFALQVIGAGGAFMTIKNNTLGGNASHSIRIGTKGTTTGNGIIRGIFTNSPGSMNISGNLIQNLTHNSSSATALFRAIECQTGTLTIRGNSINNVAAEGTSTSVATQEGIGILISTAFPDVVIDSNTISNLSLTNVGALGTVLSGIYIGSLTTGARITRNKLYGFSNASTGVSTTTPPVATAIYLRDVASGELFVANNMVSLGTAQPANTSFIGIWNQVNPVTGYTERIYYNSINIDGIAATGAQPSFAFYRGNFSATAFTGPTLDIRNNIFINNRSGGTGLHFAIANSYGAAVSSAGGWAANASDYNVLNANASTVGYWSGNLGMAGWQASSLGDNNSLNAVTVSFVNAASDLHLVAGANAAVEGKGTPLATVLTDIDNSPRDAVLPDLGADELLNLVPVSIEFFRGQKQPAKNLLQWKASSNAASVTFTIERSGDGIIFSPAGSITANAFTQTFSFYDISPNAGINYYRLKMLEDNGSISYSGIISLVSGIKDMQLSIRPNYITGGTANLYVQSEKELKAIAVITDASGRIVLEKTMTIPAGTGNYPLNVSALPKGIYQVTLRGNGWMETGRVVLK